MKGILIVTLAVAAAVQPVPLQWDSDCACPAARLRNGWCRSCKVGYVGSVEICSELLFEAVDAHGHRIDPDSITCPTCRSGLRDDGFCAECRLGFVGGQLYFSRLTYHLARGRVTDPASIQCAVCRAGAARRQPLLEGGGWCDACRIGMVGNVAFTDRQEFEAASRQLDRLLEAVGVADRCELCAVALFYDGTCPTCGITYRDAMQVEAPPPGQSAGAAPGP